MRRTLRSLSLPPRNIPEIGTRNYSDYTNDSKACRNEKNHSKTLGRGGFTLEAGVLGVRNCETVVAKHQRIKSFRMSGWFHWRCSLINGILHRSGNESNHSEWVWWFDWCCSATNGYLHVLVSKWLSYQFNLQSTASPITAKHLIQNDGHGFCRRRRQIFQSPRASSRLLKNWSFGHLLPAE